MIKVKKVVINLLVIMLLLLSNISSASDFQQLNENYYSDIIEFILARDLVIEGQQMVIQKAMSLEQERPFDFTDAPLYLKESLLQDSYEIAVIIQSAQAKLSALEKALIDDVFTKLTQIFILKNKIQNSQELYYLLEQRVESTERQVQAGIVDANVLWALTESMMTAQSNIADANTQIQALEIQVAISYGGADWVDLLELIRRHR